MRYQRFNDKKRISLLKNGLAKKGFFRFIEAHNGLSAIIAEEAKVQIETNNGLKTIEFDGFWESSLTDSASKGLPDIEIVSIDSRLQTINQIMEVTEKPMIVDGDTGGDISGFGYFISKLERAGVSAVIIEDKQFPKRNSLESGSRQVLEDPALFAEKIRMGQAEKSNRDFMIIARLESLIAGLGLKDAVDRAKIYLKAGADGIMIHSKSQTVREVLDFAAEFKNFPKKLIEGKCLVSVPTTYNTIYEEELEAAGFNIVIYANHLLRSSALAMEKTAKIILEKGRCLEAEPLLMSVPDIFAKVGFLEIKRKDKDLAKKLSSSVKVIIPAAGKDKLSEKFAKPKALFTINGKTILERQTDVLRKCGLDNFIVITGYQAEQFKMENINYVFNEEYEKKYIAYSLFQAKEYLGSPFVILYSDILLQESIVKELLEAGEIRKEGDIILAVDSAFQEYKNKIGKTLDLVKSKNKQEQSPRKLLNKAEEEVSYIGNKLEKETADYEFIGLAYFSQRGAEILKEIYNDCLIKYQDKPFHEAKNIAQADITDLIQEIVDRGYAVKLLKVYQGWLEIENEEAREEAEKLYL